MPDNFGKSRNFFDLYDCTNWSATSRPSPRAARYILGMLPSCRLACLSNRCTTGLRNVRKLIVKITFVGTGSGPITTKADVETRARAQAKKVLDAKEAGAARDRAFAERARVQKEQKSGGHRADDRGQSGLGASPSPVLTAQPRGGRTALSSPAHKTHPIAYATGG